MNLYISTYLAPYRLDLCERLSRDYGFAIYHYVGKEVPDGLDGLLPEYGFESKRLPTGCFLGKPYAKGLDALLGHLRPAWVFVQEFSLITLQLLLLRGKYGFRVVSFCDDSMDMISGNDFGVFHRVARHIVPKLLDNIVLNSPAVAGWYQSSFGKGLELPILADESLFRQRLARAVPAAVVLRRKMVPDGRRMILFVGRLVATKNLPLLIQAGVAVKEQARLVIVGEGEEREALERQAKERGVDAVFAGPAYGLDLLAFYQAADVLVLPSKREAFGAVVGEALMAGCPVLVSDKAGASSLVREGVNGYSFRLSRPEGLSTLLQKVLLSGKDHDPGDLRVSLCPVSFEASFRKMMETLL